MILYFVPYLKLKNIKGPTYDLVESVFSYINGKHYLSDGLTETISLDNFWEKFDGAIESWKSELLEQIQKGKKEADGFLFFCDEYLKFYSFYFPYKYSLSYHSQEKAKEAMSIKRVYLDKPIYAGPADCFYVLKWAEEHPPSKMKPIIEIEDFETEAEYEQYLKSNAELLKQKTNERIKVTQISGYSRDSCAPRNPNIKYTQNGQTHSINLVDLLQKLHP